MLLPGFIHLSFILMLAADSKGLDWSINVTKIQQEKPGSDITVQCTFTYPEEYRTNDLKVTWMKSGTRKRCRSEDRNINQFIFHPDNKCVEDEYRGRTSLIGDQSQGNCTLQIKNITRDVSIFLRVYAKQDYSFAKDDLVYISVTGGAAVTPNPNLKKKPNPEAFYVAICVPVNALMIIVIVVGVFFYIKRKRSRNLTREASYVNFSRTSADIPKGSFSTKENATINEPEANIEPIYMNYEAPVAENIQSEEPTENLYGNVDYLKN